MDSIKNTILSTAEGHPYMMLMAIIILILIIVVMWFNPGEYFGKSKKCKKKNLESADEIDELIESINEKQKRCRQNKQ